MKKVPEKVVGAVSSLRNDGWKTEHLLNISEFINVHFQNARVHMPGEHGDIIANYLAEDQSNITPYVMHVVGDN